MLLPETVDEEISSAHQGRISIICHCDFFFLNLILSLYLVHVAWIYTLAEFAADQDQEADNK